MGRVDPGCRWSHLLGASCPRGLHLEGLQQWHLQEWTRFCWPTGHSRTVVVAGCASLSPTSSWRLGAPHSAPPPGLSPAASHPQSPPLQMNRLSELRDPGRCDKGAHACCPLPLWRATERENMTHCGSNEYSRLN